MRPDYVSRVFFRGWFAVAALALLFLSGGAHARKSERYEDMRWTLEANAANASRLGGTPNPNRYSFGMGTLGPTYGGSSALPWTPNKTQVGEIARWKSMATPQNLAKGMMNPVAAAMTLIGGSAAAWVANEACVRVFGGVMTTTAGVQWEECKFITSTIPAWTLAGYPSELYPSAQAACDRMKTIPANAWRPNLEAVVDPNLTFCRLYSNGAYVNGLGLYQNTTMQVTERDPDTPWIPATPQVAEDALKDALTEICFDNVNQTYCVDLLKQMVEGGAQVEVTDLPLEGPASVDGGEAKSTKTNPDGSTTTTTKKTEYKCTYSDQTVTCRQTVTTTTTTKADGQPDETQTESEEEEDDTREKCEKDKSALGCNGELDSPEVEIPRTTSAISYEPEALGLGAGSCPADVAWTDSLGSHAISFAPICNAVSTIVKPLLLLSAALMAIFILAPVGREP